MWGHDAKIIKIGVIPTGGSPGQGKTNRSQDRRQDLGPISKCITSNYVRDLHGQRDIGAPIDHTGGGGEIGVPKGAILVTKNEPKSKVSPMIYLHAGFKIGPAAPHAIHREVQWRLPCTWLSKISMPLGVVTVQTGSTTDKMAKSAVSGDRPG